MKRRRTSVGLPRNQSTLSRGRISQAKKLQSALSHHQAGDRAKAARIYKMVLSKEPNNVHALCFLGALECERGEHGTGLEHINRAITIIPQFSQGYCNLGVALHGQRNWREAEKAFRQALTIKPDYAQAYSYLGASLAAQSKLDEAEKTVGGRCS